MESTPDIRTARALHPHRPAGWEAEYLPRPLLVPEDHPELDLFGAAPEKASPPPATIDVTVEPSSLLSLGSAPKRAISPEGLASPPAPASEPVLDFDALPLEEMPPPSDEAGLLVAAPPSRLDEPLPSRMLNEFVYCPRLFYYEYVEGVFVDNEDTERGSALHAKVDKGKGDLPPARKSKAGSKKQEDARAREGGLFPDEAEAAVKGDGESEEAADAATEAKPEAGDQIIHSRSATLSSERLGVLAKMDLIEILMGAGEGGPDGMRREMKRVTPVDYKAGAPRKGEEANELWDTDKMQLGLQILILRDHGYRCDEGVIYYRATKQRVRLPMTEGLERWIITQIGRARETACGPMPPPLVGSPKCVRCSLAPVCLPDETWTLSRREPVDLAENEEAGASRDVKVSSGTGFAPPRRLMAARDDARALYLNTPGLHVGRKDELLVVKDGAAVVDEFRSGDVAHVALFGNIQVTTQTVQMLCEREIPLAYFSMGGWFYGLTRGHGTKNVFTRIEQFRAAGDPLRSLALARKFVSGKIRNQRTLLMRLHVEAPAPVLARLRQASRDVLKAASPEELLGMEGAAAALYLQHFSGMIKAGPADDDEIPGLETEKTTPEPTIFTFDFTHRSRRPPADPVNALLSLAYSLLAKDCTIAAHAVGFDPYVGFYHQPRFGRPALALDLMEEFRPLIAESAVLTAINNRMLTPGHFVRAGEGVNLTQSGRKVFFQAYEQRMNSIITHPVFDYKVSYRRVLELQARLLARYLTGEIPEYIPMLTR